METEEVSVVSNQQIKLRETVFSVLGTVWPADEGIQGIGPLVSEFLVFILKL